MGEANRKNTSGAFYHAAVADRLDANRKAFFAALKEFRRDYVVACAAMKNDYRVSRAVVEEMEGRIRLLDLGASAVDYDDIGDIMRMLDSRHPTPDLVRVM